jgi:hypothetical protein
MSDHAIGSLVAVISAILGLAIVAVLVSNRAQTAGVITSAGAALANDISAAVAPVTGAQAQINTGGGNGFGGFSLQGPPMGSVNY